MKRCSKPARHECTVYIQVFYAVEKRNEFVSFTNTLSRFEPIFINIKSTVTEAQEFILEKKSVAKTVHERERAARK